MRVKEATHAHLSRQAEGKAPLPTACHAKCRSLHNLLAQHDLNKRYQHYPHLSHQAEGKAQRRHSAQLMLPPGGGSDEGSTAAKQSENASCEQHMWAGLIAECAAGGRQGNGGGDLAARCRPHIADTQLTGV